MSIRSFDSRHFRPANAETGFALYTALIFLVVLTIVGVAMYSSMGLQQKMSGNMQQKLRALSAADNATGVAEGYLNGVLAGNVAIPVVADCSGQVTAPRICNYGSLPDPVADSTWSAASGVGVQLTGTDFPPASVVPGGGVEGAYAAFPQYYVELLPTLPGYTLGTGQQYGGGSPIINVYRVTGWGLGGNASAVAVVQAIYRP